VIWAVRSARTLDFMTKADAEALNIDPANRQGFIRVANGKANYAPTGSAQWLKIQVQALRNGDDVAVVTSWVPEQGASLTDIDRIVDMVRGGEYRHDTRAENAITKAIASLLEVHPTRATGIYAHLLQTQVLSTEERPDAKRRPRKFVVVGKPRSGFFATEDE
jgi:hypothetical protein